MSEVPGNLTEAQWGPMLCEWPDAGHFMSHEEESVMASWSIRAKCTNGHPAIYWTTSACGLHAERIMNGWLSVEDVPECHECHGPFHLVDVVRYGHAWNSSFRLH